MSEMEKIKETSLLRWKLRWLEALIGPKQKGVCHSGYNTFKRFYEKVTHIHRHVPFSIFMHGNQGNIVQDSVRTSIEGFMHVRNFGRVMCILKALKVYYVFQSHLDVSSSYKDI